MPDDDRLLEHLVFDRVPDKEPGRRTRPYHPPSLPPRQADHGTSLSTQTSESTQQVLAARKSLSVRSQTLLVLELTSYDLGTREQLEKLGAAVVEERRLSDNKWGLVVQFPDVAALARFADEARAFRTSAAGVLPVGARDSLLMATESVRPVSVEERKGLRLKQQGLPDREPFYLDVDLWHPGDTVAARRILEDLRGLAHTHQGRVTDDGRTPTLLIARVLATKGLADDLLNWDEVARVEIPAAMAIPHELVLGPASVPVDLRPPDATAPLVGVLDSGVLAGHPMLAGTVYAEEDFGSSEATATDLHGHGTAVAGHVVYGDVGQCVQSGEWTPRLRIASGKVLQRNSSFPDEAPVFPDGLRPEKALEQAIRRFHSEYGCRVFNMSLGDFTPYAGGRQTPCAEILDKLARELDVLLVVAAGNVPKSELPSVPNAATPEATQRAMLQAMLDSKDQRISDPATSAIAITVGALSRSEAIHGNRRRIPATPANTTAVFSRIGPGYSMLAPDGQAAVKPEFVAPGGNFAFESLAGVLNWVVNESGLREPALRLPSKGGPLGYAAGTSTSAPQLAHATGLALDALVRTRTGTPSANAVRALLGVTAEAVPGLIEALSDLRTTTGAKWSVDDSHRRLAGYGSCNSLRISGSSDSDAVLFAEDALTDDRWHIFEIPVPEKFTSTRGPKRLSVALAFDPPTRSSRRIYLARTMSFYAVQGLDPGRIEAYLAKPLKNTEAERLPDKHCVKLGPSRMAVSYSTLQVRRHTWTGTPQLSDKIYIVVVSQKRFEVYGDDGPQRYALAIRLAHADRSVRIYEHLRSHARIRTRARVTTRT